MGAIYRLQLREHLQSARFQVSLLLLLAFFAANGMVYTWKLERLQEDLALLDRADEQAYQELTSVQEGVGHSFRNQGDHPRGREFIADGGIGMLKSAVWASAQTGDLPELWYGMTRNAIIDNFQVIDWSLIARFVVSFLCVVLAYDTVSRELEAGTLQLVLSNPVTRGAYLAGKGLAHLTTVMLSVGVGSLVSLAVLAAGGRLAVGAGLALDLGLFLAAVALLATLFLLLAIGVSALARSSASSSVVLVLVWTIAVAILPQLSALIGLQVGDRSLDPSGPAYDYLGQARQALADRGLTFRGAAVGAVDGYAQEREAAQHLREAEREQERIYREGLRQQARQFQVARAVNLLSPGYAFQYAVEALHGVGVAHRDALEEQSWEYRQALREFYQTADAADAASPHIRFFPDYMSKAPLDHRLIPRFHERRLTLAEGVRAGVTPLAILLLEVAAALVFAHRAMLRLEVTAQS